MKVELNCDGFVKTDICELEHGTPFFWNHPTSGTLLMMKTLSGASKRECVDINTGLIYECHSQILFKGANVKVVQA